MPPSKIKFVMSLVPPFQTSNTTLFLEEIILLYTIFNLMLSCERMTCQTSNRYDVRKTCIHWVKNFGEIFFPRTQSECPDVVDGTRGLAKKKFGRIHKVLFQRLQIPASYKSHGFCRRIFPFCLAWLVMLGVPMEFLKVSQTLLSLSYRLLDIMVNHIQYVLILNVIMTPIFATNLLVKYLNI